jgi:hypothetical protein
VNGLGQYDAAVPAKRGYAVLRSGAYCYNLALYTKAYIG